MGAERPLPTRGAVAWSRCVDASTAPIFFLYFFLLLDKSRNLSKFVSVLLSASIERVGVSRMWDFFLINHATFPKLYGPTIRIGREILCLPYAGAHLITRVEP